MEDFYKTLKVKKDATKDEIKKSYRKLCKKHHPDKGGKEEDFCKINLAHEVLSDEENRGKYDRGEPIFNTVDPEAFIRGRVLSLFEQQINAPNFNVKRTDIFGTIVSQLEQLISNSPIAEVNANKQIEKYEAIKDRITGDNTEIYINSLQQKIDAYKSMVEGIPQEIEQMEKVIEYVKKTEYRTDPVEESENLSSFSISASQFRF